MSRTLDITDKFRQSQVPLYHHHHPPTADHRVKVAIRELKQQRL